MQTALFASRHSRTAVEKLRQVNVGLIFLIAVVSSIGFGTLYSAAGGSWDPWASRQMIRFVVGVVLMLGVAVVDQRVWFRIAYGFYFAAFVLLVIVDVAGAIGMGAQRWLDIGGIIQIQPSELMKIALILTLARYFHGLSLEEIGNPLYLLWPAFLVLAPAALVAKQPDLGSAILLVLMGAVIFFLAGVRVWMFLLVGGSGIAAVPIALKFLRGYQRQRLVTFMDPESDPLGAGYHIIQSKIALGSGGVWGKGFLQGTQSHLQFLPERQTDFIFTMLCEEWGFVGGLALIGMYTLILLYGISISLRSRSQFGRLTGMGVVAAFYIYAAINMAMVMGVLPVVGEPLPLVSYGGTSMMSLLIAFGLLMNVYVHRDQFIGRWGSGTEG
ncbi:MAG TPA: rod shape-determining protein RodA [Alphaproteobacteria bacterium]|nr:rod shape-determining protein RodA [Alphaproteobacteria bacterium]